MGLIGFDKLFAAADERKPQIPVAVAGGADSTVLSALAEAQNRGWIQPMICGSTTAIETQARQINVDLSRFTVIDSNSPAATAVDQVRSGNAQLLMKGQVATPDLMKAVLHRETGLRTGKTICQVVLMEIIHT